MVCDCSGKSPERDTTPDDGGRLVGDGDHSTFRLDEELSGNRLDEWEIRLASGGGSIR